MSAAVGASQVKVRPLFWILALASVAAGLLIAGLFFSLKESHRTERAAPAKLPPLPPRNETRRAAPPPRTETAKIEPVKPNATIGVLPKNSAAKIEPVKPDAKISLLPKKSKAAKAAAKKRAARQKAITANLPPLPLRNARRPAAGAPKTATASKPAKNAKPQAGKASWYDFDGRTTANGETMDRDALTAAHKSLPLGSKAVVENLDNGREVEVRINDRGPFVGGRIIDLSKEAADQIGMLGDGVAKVVVKPAEAGEAAPAEPAKR